MKKLFSPNPIAPGETGRRSRWPWLLAASCLLVILITLLLPREDSNPANRAASTNALRPVTTANSSSAGRTRLPHRSSNSEPVPTAEEIVASKLSQFIRNRRELVHSFAKHLKVEVPAEVERFFDLAEAGNWDDLRANFDSLKKLRQSDVQPEGLPKVWVAVQETFGVAEVAHDWPAQKLLDYGESVLGALRPGMVYVGGTDPGRFIPTLLNETTEGERHIVLTQNALADNSYLEYVNFLYGDRLTTLTQEDSQHAFQDYLSDAQKRALHDQQLPNEPAQLRPGEDVRITDNRVQVSGQVAVMAINEKLLQTLMQKNPGASIAMEESFPFNSMFAGAAPLGPIMELRVRDENHALTRERAAQSVDYWRATAQQLLSDPEASESPDVLKTYSKMVSSQGGLLASHNYTAEAEQAFRLATEICPYSPEAVFRLVNLLVGQNRSEDAVPVAEAAVKAEPQNQQFRNLVEQLKKTKKN